MSIITGSNAIEGERHLWTVSKSGGAVPRQIIKSPLEHILYIVTPLQELFKNVDEVLYPLGKPSSSVTEEIITLFQKLMSLKVRVPEPSEVWMYLEKHPNVIRLTNDLVELVSEELADAVLSLEVFADPEGADEYLVLYARFFKYDDTTMEKIRSVRKKFLLRLSGEKEWPLLTTDFHYPYQENEKF